MPVYKNPRVQYYVVLGTLLLILAWLYWGSVMAVVRPLLGQAPFDLQMLQAVATLAFALFITWLTRDLFFRLVSQFALPVSTPEERGRALDHFFVHSAGLPGPAIFVRDGEQMASPREKETRNVAAGGIVVDSVSGVVLRNDTAYTRAHGPGVVFTQAGEYIGAALDLRKQVRTAAAVNGLTRDGITVTADLTVIFMLENARQEPFPAWEDGDAPPYYFDEYHALSAVMGSAVRDDRPSDWRELPTHLAADVWREVLLLRDFDSLFSKDKDAPALLGSLIAEVRRRLKEDPNAHEYQLLQARGLRVLSVGYSNLTFSDELKKLRMDQWQKDWQSRAGELAEDKDPAIKKIKSEGEREGRFFAVTQLTQFIREQLSQGNHPPAADVLANLAARTRELATDPGVKKEINMADIQGLLLTLEVWVDKYRTGNKEAL